MIFLYPYLKSLDRQRREKKSDIPMYTTKNFQKTTYFQIFHNLKIDKLVKAIELSPITALGPE